jgi:Type IV secretion-system coupling protein DNA-binding domain
MIRLNLVACSQATLLISFIAASVAMPNLASAQASPFLTGATALQTNILAWLTPIAVILIMVLGGMAMANRIVENCGNTLILRCSASEGGGTSRFASRLIGEREVLRTTESRSRRPTEWLASTTRSEHFSTEAALLPSEIEQLPDLAGFLKVASRPEWLRVTLTHAAAHAAAPGTADVRAEAKRKWAHGRADQHGLRSCGRVPEATDESGRATPFGPGGSRSV